MTLPNELLTSSVSTVAQPIPETAAPNDVSTTQLPLRVELLAPHMLLALILVSLLVASFAHYHVKHRRKQEHLLYHQQHLHSLVTRSTPERPGSPRFPLEHSVRPRRVSVPVIKVMRRYSYQPPVHFHSVDCAGDDHTQNTTTTTTTTLTVADKPNTFDTALYQPNGNRRASTRHPCPPIIIESDDDDTAPTSPLLTSSHSFNIERRKNGGNDVMDQRLMHVTLSEKQLTNVGVKRSEIAML